MKQLKILALVLVLMLALPAAGMADELGACARMIRFTDPVITIESNGETMVYDVTGLGVQLGLAADLTGDVMNAMGSLVLLTDGQPSATFMGGIDGGALYALATGISKVYTISPEDFMKRIAKRGGVYATDFRDGYEAGLNFSKFIEGLSIEDGEPRDVAFLGGEVENCPVKTLRVTGADIKKYMDRQIDIPADMVIDIMYAEAGDGRVHFEGTITGFEDDGDGQLDFNGNISRDGDSVRGGYVIGDESDEVNFTFSKSIGDAAGTISAQADFYVTDLEDGEIENSMHLVIEPKQAEDGSLAHVLSLKICEDEDETVTASLDCMYAQNGSDESFSVSVGEGGAEPVMTVEYQGTIDSSETAVTHGGELNIWADNAGIEVNISSKCAVVISSDSEGMLPDIGSMEAVDYSGISEEDMVALKVEAQQLLITVMGKVMAVPAVANLIVESGMMPY